MDLSVQLSLTGSFSEIVEHAALADQMGYRAVTAGQISARDPLTSLAALAMRTQRIELGTSVLPIYARSPASMAQAAATLADLSGGRFTLGLGVGHRATMGGWHGQEIGRPVAEMREYASIVRAILEGRTPVTGRRWQSTFALTAPSPVPRVPFHLAGLSPAMLRLAGEVADGVLLWTTPPRYIQDVVLPAILEGRARRGLGIDGFEIMPIVPTAFVDDPDAAIAGVRQELHRYFSLPFYRAMFAAAGYGDDIAAFDAAAPDVDAQKSAISDRFVHNLCVIGGPDELAAGLARYEAAGATNAILRAPGGGDPGAVLRAAASIKSLV